MTKTNAKRKLTRCMKGAVCKKSSSHRKKGMEREGKQFLRDFLIKRLDSGCHGKYLQWKQPDKCFNIVWPKNIRNKDWDPQSLKLFSDWDSFKGRTPNPVDSKARMRTMLHKLCIDGSLIEGPPESIGRTMFKTYTVVNINKIREYQQRSGLSRSQSEERKNSTQIMSSCSSEDYESLEVRESHCRSRWCSGESNSISGYISASNSEDLVSPGPSNTESYTVDHCANVQKCPSQDQQNNFGLQEMEDLASLELDFFADGQIFSDFSYYDGFLPSLFGDGNVEQEYTFTDLQPVQRGGVDHFDLDLDTEMGYTPNVTSPGSLSVL